MKKTAILMAFAAMAMTASAASINWTISGAATGTAREFDGVTIAANTTLYFIVANDLTTITSSSQLASEFFTDLSALTITTSAALPTGKKPTVSALPVSSPLLTSGQLTTFGMLYVSEDGLGNGFYRIVTNVAAPYADGAQPIDQQEVITSFSTMAGSGWVQGYAAPVPEPATAALALAGLAMLIRRRK